MNSNTDWCLNPPYVYDSSSNTTSDFEFTGDDKSDCTLLIHNVQFSYSGVYKFRFITNVTGGKYTGQPGVTLQVADLKVSLIRLSGNGTLKQGDSLNLTCDVNCTHTSSQFVWSKNNQRLDTSGPVLHFPALTVRDSGNYTCTWKTGETSGSETISLHVEGENPTQWPAVAVVTAVVLFIIFVILGAVIYRRWKNNTLEDKSAKAGAQTQVKQLPQSNEEVSKQEEVTYATVSIKDNNLNKGKRVKAQEENSGKGAEKAKDAENTDDKQPKPQLSSVPQLDVETLHEEEVTYASVCVKDKKLMQGSSNTTSDFEFTGDDKSDCTLLIHNVQFSYSGEYRFRFITNVTKFMWTGQPGVTLQVTDLKVSLIRLSRNGTLKQGDSLNLTCDVNCTHTSSQFVWSKNNQHLNTSGPVLYFPALTVRDSGNYTCTWKTGETSGSETISLHVEGDVGDAAQWKIWIIVLVTAGVILISLVTGAVIYNRRSVHAEQQKEDDSTIYTNIPQTKSACVSLANVQQQKEDDSTIYANVPQKKGTCVSLANVQQQQKGFAIYANVQ
ncbi:hypothetical protein QTP70_024624 [Hemibagrus guttatus]|uniref:Ig-like domain-containing protein n=1 Tax=Hemibagrus guttatus TaxID=175788 RepID=A0AAE0Q8L6_9TELE|nr:hypothetical protein QTP70_024624 [Hemibagrus guttatus]